MFVRNIMPVCIWTGVRAISAASSCGPSQSLTVGNLANALVGPLSLDGGDAAVVTTGFLQPKTSRTAARRQLPRQSTLMRKRLRRSAPHFNLLLAERRSAQ